MASVLQSKVSLCKLCGLYPIVPALSCNTHGYSHWFNRLGFICTACHQSIEWQQAKFEVDACGQQFIGLASTSYTYPYNKVMTNFKNHHAFFELLPLIHALRQLPTPQGCHADNSVIIPVPSSIPRLKERGFDPIFWLSQYLSFHWQIPIFTAVKREERAHQQGLSREQRLANLSNAMIFKELPTVQHLIIFDDVVTTGATLAALIEALPNPLAYQLHLRAILHGNG